ncbi:phosphoribosylamine--glycine ligase [Dubosiella muris]|uniref:Phosphoribosylamine--glycine ligase n=1 Tax=Dubosiella muris TaxID=3038133 RepID=A0AC61R4R3_9FIRM|nr:phosphoribosylamine--glycine ligase [Dubosiella muris]TGY64837.1 phosphoribosylamine--glycine ligase [Dubosiella muris]
MNVLVVGKGGREHALARAASLSPQCETLYMAPGNPGMAKLGTCVPVADNDIEGLVQFAKDHAIDLTIVGPEATLALGIADAFEAEGLTVFGPSQAATQVESSKDFAKEIMKKYDIPTAAYATFDNFDDAWRYVQEQGAPIVVKEDGLKAGKGVTVAMRLEDAREALEIAFAIPDNKVVIEQYLEGFEYSLIALVHNDLVVPLEIAQDHKRAYDNDEGPNTGGMGSYSPVKRITPDIVEQTMTQVMEPMAKALVEEGVPFTGFLYGGLMLTNEGIKTIEFNARFGDPEAEVILSRLESDFLAAIQSVLRGEKPALQWSSQVSHGVVLASTNYPASSTKGVRIEGLDEVEGIVYHMGTKEEDGTLLTDGGRVLMLVSLADDLESAYEKTYANVAKVKSDALFYRSDIGRKDM